MFPNIQITLITETNENITSLKNKESDNNIEMSSQTISKMIKEINVNWQRGDCLKNLKMYIEFN